MENLGICENCHSVFPKEYIGKTCPVCENGEIIPSEKLPDEEGAQDRGQVLSFGI